jgi:hypothetical protein
MTSKAERKRRKRTVIVAKGGRPRMNGPREPNGRLDRKWRETESAREARQTVTEARQRVYGLSEGDARKEEAMTVLGRLSLTGEVSNEQLDAAKRWQEIRNRYRLAMGIAPDYAEPGPETEGSGLMLDEWVHRVRAQYRLMCEELDQLCIELRSPAPKAALDVIVVRDVEMPELVGALRLALNSLARHFSGQKMKLPEVAA